MAYSFVASTKIAGVNGGITPAITTTGATLLVAAVATYDAAPGTLSDSKGNTWTALTTSTEASIAMRSLLYYCANPTVGSGHTFTVSGTASFSSLIVGAWSGAKLSSPLDQQNGAVSGGAVATLATGSVTPTDDNQLLVTTIGTGGTGTHSVDLSFTLVDDIAGVSSVNYGCGLGVLIETSAAAKNPTWTLSSAAGAAARIATFKAAAGIPVPLLAETMVL